MDHRDYVAVIAVGLQKLFVITVVLFGRPEVVTLLRGRLQSSIPKTSSQESVPSFTRLLCGYHDSFAVAVAAGTLCVCCLGH